MQRHTIEVITACGSITASQRATPGGIGTITCQLIDWESSSMVAVWLTPFFFVSNVDSPSSFDFALLD